MLWSREKALELLSRLRSRYSVQPEEFVAWKLVLDNANDFEIIVATILSQNTSDRNALRAFQNLRDVLGEITPEKIARIDIETLARCIAVAGLQNRKARILKELASRLIEIDYRSFFSTLRNLDVEEARKRLLELPGIGRKTADVYLLMRLNKPTYPIDTHNQRVLKRLGIARENDGYEDMRRRMLELLPPDPAILRDMHMLIIQHGRETCRARSPLCSRCIARDLCLYASRSTG